MAMQTTGVDYTALHRALCDGITATRLGRVTWRVTGSRGGTYEVVYGGEGGLQICDCPAGRHERPCKHLALVKVLERSGAVPIPPRAVPDPAARRALSDAYDRYVAMVGA